MIQADFVTVLKKTSIFAPTGPRAPVGSISAKWNRRIGRIKTFLGCVDTLLLVEMRTEGLGIVNKIVISLSL